MTSELGGTKPNGLHPRRSGFEPDHAADRSGLADRAAVSEPRAAIASRRHRRRNCRLNLTRHRTARGTRAILAGWGQRRRFSVELPMANSSRLVFPNRSAGLPDGVR